MNNSPKMVDRDGNVQPIHWIGNDEHGDRYCFVPEGCELTGCQYWTDQDGNAHVTSDVE
jgi:hypothetical protein